MMIAAMSDRYNESGGGKPADDKLSASRGVAQPGSAPALGAGGRWFESSRPDHFWSRGTRSRTDRGSTRAERLTATTRVRLVLASPGVPVAHKASCMATRSSLRGVVETDSGECA